MRLRTGNVIVAVAVFLLSQGSYPASKALLSDKSLPLEERLDQLYQKPDLLNLIYDSLESPEPVQEPVPLQLAKTLNLEHLYHPRVQFYLDYFTGPARNHFQVYLQRSALYQDYIQSALRENNLPESLFYLAMIESGFNPYARSRRGAGGIWQFMPGTARRFGLEVDFWVDERRDPEKSTRAAIAYLKDLYQRFGSWPLALASYNAGEGKVARVMEENDSDDYWELIELTGLRQETKDYLPKMIAACIIAESPEEYGFVKPEKQPAPQLEKLLVKDAVDLYKVAKVAGVSGEEIQKMNPALLRGITPPGRQYEINIPNGMGEVLLAAYQKLKPEERVTYAHHKVRKGETLGEIAQKYGVTVEQIRAFNHISRVSLIKTGQDLVIPVSCGKASAIIAYSNPQDKKSSSKTKNQSAPGKNSVKYKVKSGDTLYSIARRNGVSVEELKRWNGLSSNTIHTGQTLIVGVQKSPTSVAQKSSQTKTTSKSSAKSQSQAKQTSSTKVYQVQPGDTLWKISQLYNVDPNDLMEWNNLSSSKIKPGDTIIIRAD